MDPFIPSRSFPLKIVPWCLESFLLFVLYSLELTEGVLKIIFVVQGEGIAAVGFTIF